MENNHDIDKKFNEASQSTEDSTNFPGFDKVWGKVEEKLDKNVSNQKKKLGWLPYSIAASLIIGFGALYFYSYNTKTEVQKVTQTKSLPNSNADSIDRLVKSNIEKEIKEKRDQKQDILAYENVKVPKENINKPNNILSNKNKIIREDVFTSKPVENAPLISSIPVDSGVNEKNIEDVIVLGYAKRVTHKSYVASSTKESANLIASNSMISGSFSNRISREVSGMSIAPSLGVSSPSKSVIIRGGDSISSDIHPLYVIDGEVADYKKFRKLKGENLKEVKVLKAASAMALYGSKSKNGVILITTKNNLKKDITIDDIEEIKEELPKAGQLTAGEVNDFSKWDYWMDIATHSLERYKNEWQFFPEKRVSVQLVNKNKKPIVGEKLKLVDEKNQVIWEAVTDNLGNAELWINPLMNSSSNSTKYAIKDFNNNHIISDAKEFKNGQNLIILDKNCIEKRTLDLAFVVDATGSMGDEIAYLQSELLDVLKKVESQLKNTEVRYGSVFYRDKGDEYVTKKFDFNSNANQLLEFIKEQNAAGGGDFPEAVVEAMDVSINELKWSSENSTKIMFLILDAPPHRSNENIQKLLKYVKTAAQKGITIIPLSASDIDKQTEYLMRTFALMTNGTYTFLTNHSGIGNNHIEPTVESYEVEKLNDLLLRLILQRASIADCNRNDIQNNLNKKLEAEINKTSENSIKVYPNPTKGPLNFVSDEIIDELYVYDLAGKIIMKREKLNGKSAIDLSAYPQSVYLIRAKTKKGWGTFKVIKN